jgi:hypothetical protein
MSGHRHLTKRGWILAGAGTIVVAAHLMALRYVVSHVAVSAAVVSSVVVLVVAKHLAGAVVFGPLSSRFRRRR